jgi:hypothetical protein
VEICEGKEGERRTDLGLWGVATADGEDWLRGE